MNNRSDLELLQQLQALGTEFTVSAPAPYGNTHFTCSPADLLKLLDDKDAFLANCYGVTKSDYLACLANEFTARCIAKTAKGRQCSNSVENGTGLHPKDWVAKQGEYCHIHSGSSAAL